MTPRRHITRRELTFAGSGLLLAAQVPNAWGARLLSTKAAVGRGTFEDGVASGDPAPDAVVFWGRLTTEQQRSGAELVVAEDPDLKRTVATAIVPTSRSVDGALKARITGLKPDTVYHYVWRSADDVSPVGRTKTAPAPDSDAPLRLAFSSCQNYPVGFFTGHQDAAKLDVLDLYLFLGDYTYEYGPETGFTPERGVPAPTVDLKSYRERLKMYRADPGLRELHRLHPVAHIWDDHEVADNYSDNGPRPSDLQRAAGYKASFEWLPRLPSAGQRYGIHRTYRLGRMADVILLDQRQYRTGDGDGRPRSMLGEQQQAWFLEQLRTSAARWKIVANQAMFVPLGVAGAGVNNDQWDGYPEDQAAVRATLAGVPNTIFVTGDIHTYFTARVLAQGSSGPSVATEFVGGSITSSGFPGLAGVESAAITAANPWITYTNGADHGYAQLDLAADAATVRYRVGPISTPTATMRTLAEYRQPTGANDYETVSQQPSGVPTLAAPRTGAAVRSQTADGALARRRRRHEKLVRRAQLRAERRGA
jgi:alkaline phosphatase D